MPGTDSLRQNKSEETDAWKLARYLQRNRRRSIDSQGMTLTTI